MSVFQSFIFRLNRTNESLWSVVCLFPISPPFGLHVTRETVLPNTIRIDRVTGPAALRRCCSVHSLTSLSRAGGAPMHRSTHTLRFSHLFSSIQPRCAKMTVTITGPSTSLTSS